MVYPIIKNLKVRTSVIHKYMNYCRISTSKCKSFRDIEDKIIRAVNLGCLHEIEGNKQYIFYYHLCFVLEGNVVVDMYKDTDYFWKVSEEDKDMFDVMYQKILV